MPATFSFHLYLLRNFPKIFAPNIDIRGRIPPTLRNFTVALWMSTSKHFKGHTARVHIWWLEAQNAFFGPQGPCLVLLWPCVHTFYCHSWHSLFCPLHALECRQIKFFWLLQLSTPWGKRLIESVHNFFSVTLKCQQVKLWLLNSQLFWKEDHWTDSSTLNSWFGGTLKSPSPT